MGGKNSKPSKPKFRESKKKTKRVKNKQNEATLETYEVPLKDHDAAPQTIDRRAKFQKADSSLRRSSRAFRQFLTKADSFTLREYKHLYTVHTYIHTYMHCSIVHACILAVV